MAEPMRLQRYLALAGVASRRAAEELITAGAVRVNGRVVTELGTKVVPGDDRVDANGRRVVLDMRRRYLLLHKPRGYVTTRHDPEGRATVMDLVGSVGKGLFPVGRLDYNTEGLLLLTNDGELANALMHPRHEIEKTYVAKVRGHVSPEQIQELKQGVQLPPRRTYEGDPAAEEDHAADEPEVSAPAAAQVLSESEGGTNTWIEITLTEGKNRQVHRMCEGVGLSVTKLKRVRYAGLGMEGIRPGKARELTDDEVKLLKQQAGILPMPKLPEPGERDARGGRRKPGTRPPSRTAAKSPPKGRHEGPPKGRREGPPKGRPEGPPKGRREGPPKGRPEGPPKGRREGPPKGRPEGPPKGRHEGPPKGPRRGVGGGRPRRG